MKQKKALKMLSALAQDTRINIYRLLVKESKEGLSAGTVAEILQVPAATLSFHLAQMTNAGLLKSHKNGRTVYYRARQKAIKNLAAFLTENSFKKQQKELKQPKTTIKEKDIIVDDEENDGD